MKIVKGRRNSLWFTRNLATENGVAAGATSSMKTTK